MIYVILKWKSSKAYLKPDRPWLTSLVCLLHAKHIGKDHVKCLYVLIHFTLTKFTNTLGMVLLLSLFYTWSNWWSDDLLQREIQRKRGRKGEKEKREGDEKGEEWRGEGTGGENFYLFLGYSALFWISLVSLKSLPYYCSVSVW